MEKVAHPLLAEVSPQLLRDGYAPVGSAAMRDLSGGEAARSWRSLIKLLCPEENVLSRGQAAHLLGESSAALWRVPDLPWCKADPFYIQKLVVCLEADTRPAWHDLRQ